MRNIVLKNYFFLLVVQGSNMLVPLLSYPIIIDRIGVDLFGELALIHAFYAIFSVLISFGTGFTAVKSVSKYRFSKKIIEQVIRSTIILKFSFSVFVIIFLFSLNYFLDIFFSNSIIFFGIGFISFELVVPTWYFLGKENMKVVNNVNLISKISYLLLVYFFLTYEYFYLVPAFMLFCNVLISIPLYFSLASSYSLIKAPNLKYFKSFTSRSFNLFVVNFISTLYVNLNKLVVNQFLGTRILGFYDLADKLSIATKSPIQLISRALFPNLANKNLNESSGKNLIFILLGSILYCFILIVSASFIIEILGSGQFDQSVKIFQILCLSIPFVIMSLYVIDLELVLKNKHREILKIRIVTLLFYVTLILSYINFGESVNPLVLACIYVFCEAVSAFYSIFISKFYLKWSKF